VVQDVSEDLVFSQTRQAVVDADPLPDAFQHLQTQRLGKPELTGEDYQQSREKRNLLGS